MAVVLYFLFHLGNVKLCPVLREGNSSLAFGGDNWKSQQAQGMFCDEAKRSFI